MISKVTLSRKAGLVAGLIMATAAGTALADTVTIRADVWYPMNGEPGSAQPGYMIEMAEAIFAQHGYSVDYQTMPWERALDSVRSGKQDCVVGAYREDATDFVFPEKHWGLDQSVFYVTSSSDWRYEGIDSLGQITVALIGGYAYSDEFDQYIEENPERGQWINANNALEQNIRKVIGGRVEALLASPPVLEAKLPQLGLEGKLEAAGELGEPEPMYIACSPANPNSEQLVKWVDEGTAAMRASGELDELLAKYGLEDWQ